ncbi:glycosyltransferase family 2 protein [Pigmentiphaga aceris]|nr:glycosyltransferase [Pigmentiphaga aceris]
MLDAKTHSADASEVPEASRYAGALIGIAGNIAHGWAIDTKNPDARVIVEILIDEHPHGMCVANQQQTAGDGTGDTLHGFSLLLPERILREASNVSARVANQNMMLGASVQIGQDHVAVPAVGASQIWYNGGLVISGWLWDPTSPGTQLTVKVRHGQQVLMTALADRHHPALVWMQSAEHGFQIELPIEFADGKRHEIHLETDDGTNLPGSPLVVCCHAEGLSRLLRNSWPESAKNDVHSRKKLEILAELMRAQETRHPMTIGFSQYPQWFKLSEIQQAAPNAATSGLRAAVIITGDAGPALDRSMASIAAQRQAFDWVIHHAGDLRSAISGAAAQGADLIVGMMAGDRLAPSYLDKMALAFDKQKTIFAYSDCDQDGTDGERTNPWLKPGWDPDLFFGVDIVTPGSIWSAPKLAETLSSRPALDLPDWQTVSVLAAEATLLHDRNEATSVKHVPAVLYHRSSSAPAQPYDIGVRSAACLQALKELAERQDSSASVSEVTHYPGMTRVKWSLPHAVPSVSLIVPTRDHHRLLQACIEGILNRTTYPGRVEIIVVDNNSTDSKTLQYMESLKSHGVRILPYPGEFNYSNINNYAVSHASCEVVGLVNNDIEVLHEDWLSEMVVQLYRPNVGAVGAKLLWPNKMVQHGGVVVGIEGLAAHTGNSWHSDDPGYLGINQLVRRQSAVTAACLLVRKKDYEAINGLNGICFPVAFNDVDLCLRLRKKGLTIIWTPHAILTHAESASRGKENTPDKAARAARERAHFINKWTNPEMIDHYYHAGLTKSWAAGPYNALSLK